VYIFQNCTGAQNLRVLHEVMQVSLHMSLHCCGGSIIDGKGKGKVIPGLN
jgi:hypothetical protein